MEKYNQTLLDYPLNLQFILTDSIKGFMSDCIMLELENFGGKKLTEEVFLEFMKPYFTLYTTTSSVSLLKTMNNELMDILLEYDFEQELTGNEVILPINYLKLFEHFKEFKK
jgi:hypothetical protein